MTTTTVALVKVAGWYYNDDEIGIYFFLNNIIHVHFYSGKSYNVSILQKVQHLSIPG